MTHPKLRLIKKLNTALKDSLKRCMICPRRCGVDRTSGKIGYCRAGAMASVYSYGPHHGEEPPISGSRGSGTIFFSHCNMKCAYCQNYRFSQLDEGLEAPPETLAKYMLNLQERGCHNINLVTPTHYMPQIMSALELALESGLAIPIVYNTSGYELPEVIRLLEGIVDIYLPDMRYSDDAMAKEYSDAPGYVETDRASVKEMFRQSGNLKSDRDGVALKGVIVRLLAIPGNISGTMETLKYISREISPDMFLSIMSQFYPAYNACEHKEISDGITPSEYKIIVDQAAKLGLNSGWVQETPAERDDRFLGTNIKPNTDI